MRQFPFFPPDLADPVEDRASELADPAEERPPEADADVSLPLPEEAPDEPELPWDPPDALLPPEELPDDPPAEELPGELPPEELP